MTETRTVLEEMRKRGEDELLYALELQRSAMFSQLIELKHNIETSDRMIAELRKKGTLEWEHIYGLADGLKRLKEIRSSWQDLWNFDQQASVHDEMVFSHKNGTNKHPRYEQTLQMMVEWVNPHLHERGLDIGTGTGNLAGLFLEKGIEMAGIKE